MAHVELRRRADRFETYVYDDGLVSASRSVSLAAGTAVSAHGSVAQHGGGLLWPCDAGVCRLDAYATDVRCVAAYEDAASLCVGEDLLAVLNGRGDVGIFTRAEDGYELLLETAGGALPPGAALHGVARRGGAVHVLYVAGGALGLLRVAAPATSSDGDAAEDGAAVDGAIDTAAVATAAAVVRVTPVGTESYDVEACWAAEGADAFHVIASCSGNEILQANLVDVHTGVLAAEGPCGRQLGTRVDLFGAAPQSFATVEAPHVAVRGASSDVSAIAPALAHVLATRADASNLLAALDLREDGTVLFAVASEKYGLSVYECGGAEFGASTTQRLGKRPNGLGWCGGKLCVFDDEAVAVHALRPPRALATTTPKQVEDDEVLRRKRAAIDALAMMDGADW
ncbi:hypothetical protein M885DRAFT_618361 [Pelagophyceae sp. CCMP2097]|nr:hypothetical protein M885DRAFT_618361 [Pelagophyceae sp. CCMP2097]